MNKLRAAAAGALLMLATEPGTAQSPQPPRQPDPSLAQLLSAVGGYVATYERGFGAVLCHERYEQSVNSLAAGDEPRSGTATAASLRRRAMNSDVLAFNSGEGGWMAFRDVVDVDVKPVGNPPGRLLALAENPTRDALATAMRATAESIRQHLGTISRTMTMANGALTYLRPENQSQQTFTFEGIKTVAKMRAAVVAFASIDDGRGEATEVTTASGRAWIDPDTGRVIQTELTLASNSADAKVEVQYAAQPGIALWVPVRMFEQYNVSTQSRSTGPRGSAPTSAYVDGLATWDACRRLELKSGLVIR